jgi:hypothetical protein
MKLSYQKRHRCTSCPYGQPTEFGNKNRVFCEIKKEWASKVAECATRDREMQNVKRG